MGTKHRKEKPVPLELIQTCEFEILKYIRDVCERNGLRYYLCYGTLIGAVRHQGFIPWDDDMDVHMPREDYLKFVEITQREPHPYYRLIARETEPKFTHILPKVIDTRTKLTQKTTWSEKVQLGVYVDIWVLDGAGNSVHEAETTYLAALSHRVQWEKSITIPFPPGWGRRYAFNRWWHHIPARLLGYRYLLDKYTNFCMQRPYDDYDYVGAMAAGTLPASRNVWKREWFGDGTDVLFNGEAFRAPSNWDAVLRPEYGDYMEPPPMEERTSTHRYTLEIPDSVRKEIEVRASSAQQK